ncbi:MAG: IreB family regulatory phosphoprotein [Clostridia bacterium]|nr:IreB family regulatory phosphoprotein [Clostridia bacterium]
MEQFEKTLQIKVPSDSATKVHDTLKTVYEALELKGYNSVNQIVAYIMSGDPTYITSYNNARNLMSKIEPDEILEILVKEYLKTL